MFIFPLLIFYKLIKFHFFSKLYLHSGFRMLNEEELFRSAIAIMCDLFVLFKTVMRFDLRSNFHALLK